MEFKTNVYVTLDSALQAHQQWKARLQDAVLSGEALDVDLIRRDDCCDLGKWLYTEGRAVYGHTPEFVKLMGMHDDFHLVTSVVARIINGKDYEQAQAMLGGSSQFASASTAVALAIHQLRFAALAKLEG